VTTSYVRNVGYRRGNRSPFADWSQRSSFNVVQRRPPSRKKLSSIANTGSSTRYIGPRQPRSRCRASPANPGQDRALASDLEEPHPARKLLPARRSRSPRRRLRRALQSPPLPQELEKPNPRRCLLRQGSNHPVATRKDQTRYHPETTIAAPNECRLNFKPDEQRSSAQSRRKLSQSIRRRTPSPVHEANRPRIRRKPQHAISSQVRELPALEFYLSAACSNNGHTSPVTDTSMR